jgi:hypothetical protein
MRSTQSEENKECNRLEAINRYSCDSTQSLNMEVEFRVGNSRVVLYSIFIHVELSHHKNLFLEKKISVALFIFRDRMAE